MFLIIGGLLGVIIAHCVFAVKDETFKPNTPVKPMVLFAFFAGLIFITIILKAI